MLGVVLVLFSACNGLMDSLYDEPSDTAPGDGSIYVDASSWTEWHYINLHAEQVGSIKYEVPMEEITDDWDGKSAICTYWYDVFGVGLSKNEYQREIHTMPQQEPEHWDIAIHRNNVRTNGAGVYMTSLDDISKVGTAEEYAAMPFTEDEWNETDVWCDNAYMLQGYVGNQRIKVNNVLSQWLTVALPPIPPSFTHCGKVFIVRFSDDTMAAIRLKDYVSSRNVKCCMTIECKYPL